MNCFFWKQDPAKKLQRFPPFYPNSGKMILSQHPQTSECGKKQTWNAPNHLGVRSSQIGSNRATIPNNSIMHPNWDAWFIIQFHHCFAVETATSGTNRLRPFVGATYVPPAPRCHRSSTCWCRSMSCVPGMHRTSLCTVWLRLEPSCWGSLSSDMVSPGLSQEDKLSCLGYLGYPNWYLEYAGKPPSRLLADWENLWNLF